MSLYGPPMDLLDLEIAKKLKELKFNKPSQCYWISHCVPEKWYISRDGGFNREYHPEHTPAYSTFELLELLPANIDTKHNEPFNNFRVSINKLNAANIRWIINYHGDTFTADQLFALKLFKHNICDENLVNALGKVFVQICENGWMK